MEPIQVLEWLVVQEWYKAITSIVTAAAVLAALTPNKYDNIGVKWLRFIVDVIAFNVGNAKNKD